jgi:hypothetical protein
MRERNSVSEKELSIGYVENFGKTSSAFPNENGVCDCDYIVKISYVGVCGEAKTKTNAEWIIIRQ